MVQAKRLCVNNVNFVFSSSMGLEDIMIQIQPLICDHIIAVKNDKQVVIFSDKSEFPIGIKYLGYQGDIYYYQSIDDDSKYAIFGEEAANIFFPSDNRKQKRMIIDSTPRENVIETASITHDGLIRRLYEAPSIKPELQVEDVNIDN